MNTLSRVLVLDAGFGEYDATQYGDFESLATGIAGKSFFRAAYTPRTYEIPVMFDLARVAGRCTLVLEEADRLDDPRQFFEYDEMISRGRHYGVSICAISLYPAKLPAMLRRQTTRLIAFRQIEPRDIDYIAEIIGPAADELPDLKPFHFIDWTPSGGAHVKKLGGRDGHKNGDDVRGVDAGGNGGHDPQARDRIGGIEGGGKGVEHESGAGGETDRRRESHDKIDGVK